MTRRVSAGILLHRRRDGQIEVLLGHPGGPFFSRRDKGHWTIPKGELGDDGELLAAAVREFAEETGHAVSAVAEDPDAAPIDLGFVTQAGGKRVYCWAVEGDLDPERATSNTFEMTWPPGSGVVQSFSEIDRVAWFSIPEARCRTNRSQSEFIDRLAQLLATG
ncbi:MAG: NUDIX domain-containing protein [Chloroflexi bacterium]|nr:NUDIX domain-containing protein [Chloroflexota bacterium]